MAATAADAASKQQDGLDADAAAGCMTPKSTDTLVQDDSRETSIEDEKKLDLATTSEAEKKDPIEVQVDKPGYSRSIRTRTKTGRKYEIETQGLWTRIRSLTPQIKKRSLKERLRKRIKDFKTFWPFVLRFATQVLKLGKWRFFFHLIASTIAGLAPALRIYLSSRLIAIAQTAADKRILRKGELFTVALTSYLSGFLETWIDGLLADNNGILTRRFETMVSEHLMQARARLDVHTLGKSRVTRDFMSAASLMHALGDGSFVIGQVIDLFTSAVSLITQGSMLWSMTTAENADVATISLFSAGLMILRWFGRSYFHTTSGITDSNYNRMSQMESLSHPQMDTFGERKVLGLGDWVLQEYKKASKALGDVSLAFPRRSDPLTTATEAIKTFSDTAIYVLFALKVSEKPIGVAAMSMSSLTFIQGAARGLAASLYRFVRDVQDFGSEFAAFRAYYRVLEIKTAIEEPAEPLEYRTQKHVLEDGTVRMGMDLEFKDVSFTWPGKREKALDSISFKINAGELCAIVGYNGAGKSTLISLISRLCDPSSGQILINGQDIRHYSTKDLHNSMSLLFQDSAHMPLTLREFIGIGNLDEVDNIEKIRQAATESGAIEFIDKLEKGFESSFSGDGEMDTPETLYQQAAEWDEMFSDNEDEDEDKDDDDEPKSPKESSGKKADENKEEDAKEGKEDEKKKDKDDESDSDSDIDDEGGRLAFSGGQTQKLVMARNFMRSSDLSIFDEYSASLDPVAEHELFKRITRNRGKQTILYITHRYSTVRHADRILMLEKGKVTECGTHQELIAIPNGKYAEMCRLALGEGEETKDKPASGDEDGSEKTFVNEDDTLATKTPLPLSRPESPTTVESQ